MRRERWPKPENDCISPIPMLTGLLSSTRAERRCLHGVCAGTSWDNSGDLPGLHSMNRAECMFPIRGTTVSKCLTAKENCSGVLAQKEMLPANSTLQQE